MYARVPQSMAQFVLKIEKLSHIMGTAPIVELARAYGLHPRLWLLIKAKRSTYLIKDFISSNFKRRLSFLLSNWEVSSLLLKLQPFRVVKYSLPFYCI